MDAEVLNRQLEGVKVPFGINAGIPLTELSNDTLAAYVENKEIEEAYPRSHFLAKELLAQRGVNLAARDASRSAEETALLEAKAKEEVEAAKKVAANEQKEIKESSPPDGHAPSGHHGKAHSKGK